MKEADFNHVMNMGSEGIQILRKTNSKNEKVEKCTKFFL